jgi:hypothetical protein
VPSAQVPLALPTVPGRTVSSTITLAVPFTILDLDLTLDITHPNDPDLTATLVALDPVPGGPDDVSVLLFSGQGIGGSRANFTGTVFDDAAGTPIAAGTPPFTGRFQPQVGLGQTFGALNGQSGARTYRLDITNAGASPGTLNGWSLTFRRPLPGNNLGEPVADQFSVAARVFTLAAGNPQATDAWTAVGPAPIGNSTGGGSGSGRIGGLAVDPSDPSGNTVFVAGASGGVWKTSDFLTTAPQGPTYVPLTDFGPATSLNVGGIAVFGRNNDPGQSIVFVATGEGDTGSPGVGFLRSTDGGRTWTVLDSTTTPTRRATSRRSMPRRATTLRRVHRLQGRRRPAAAGQRRGDRLRGPLGPAGGHLAEPGHRADLAAAAGGPRRPTWCWTRPAASSTSSATRRATC